MDRRARLARLKELAYNARIHPEMFVGNAEAGHVSSIIMILQTVLLSDAFYKVHRIWLSVVENAFCVRIWSRGLKSIYSDLISWDSESDLLTDISSLCEKTHRLLNNMETAQLSGGKYLSLSTISAPCHLADRALIGIQVSGSFRWQTFTEGIPDTPINTVSDFRHEDKYRVGLHIVNEFPKEVFRNLPYKLDEVRDTVLNSISFPVEIVDERFMLTV